jgi:4a-hydroxytetrahydrobiopterin dehydratase
VADVLNPDALHHELDRLDGWGGTVDGLEKRFRFADPDHANAFLDRVAAVADELNHHPDVTVDGSTVAMVLVTHSAGGVTQQDVELARRIDPLATDDPGEAVSTTETDTIPTRPDGGGSG